MRVALLGCNAQAGNAIGNQVAEKVAFFLERGALVRVFLQGIDDLHPEVRPHAQHVGQVATRGPVWDYLSHADLVIADYGQSYELLHFLPLLAGAKPRLVLDYHGVTPAQFWQGPQRALMEDSARQRVFVWCAAVALAHSRFAKEELQRATGFPDERIVVQPYPTDLGLFRAGRSETLRRRLGCPAAPMLLYVGRLAASKRVSLLIESLPLLPDAHAVIVGAHDDVYAEEMRRCREVGQRLGVERRVHFLGRVDDADLAEIYRGADALVIPSLHEGYCLPVIEAMASGLPVVAARTSALPETVGGAGLTFAPEDTQDLARQVKRVLERSRPAAHDGSKLGAKETMNREPRTENREPKTENDELASRSRFSVLGSPFIIPLGGADKETLAPPPTASARRVALVAFRFGSGIVGGAEASLRTIAQTLQRGGHHVEVFTTCTQHESDWTNELTQGTVTLDGLTVHRFALDPHDRAEHHASIRRIVEADGRVDAAAEQAYLRHSIHSTALVEALTARRGDFDAIITGPYLFGLTADIARMFPEQTLLAPCFHDEPLARLRSWQTAYAEVGGVLYHSPEEQELAERALGLNHPRAVTMGTLIRAATSSPSAVGGLTGRYVVYCGRYSRQKNLPLLLEFAERYQRDRPGRFRFAFAGRGEVPIPRAAWASDRGRITEEDKRDLLANAAALVQLSRQESLSLVALEAWAQGTPVIAHRDCAVLRGQLARAQGGRTVASYEEFAQTLDDLWQDPTAWRTLGDNGRAYVAAWYASEDAFRDCLLRAIDDLRLPLGEMMRRRGAARAAQRDRPRWRERFGQFIERTLDDEPARPRWDVRLEPHTSACRAAAPGDALLAPVRVVNHGTLPALADGPAKTVLLAEVVDPVTGGRVAGPSTTDLPGPLAPGQHGAAALRVALPDAPGEYQIVLRAECAPLTGDEKPGFSEETGFLGTLPLLIGGAACHASMPGAGSFLETIQASLAAAHELQRLPDDYLDVTEGRCARLKRWLKHKLLGNFKKAYVDVLSRQQTQVNQLLLLTIQQLAEYCATLEHALQGLQRQADRQGPPSLEQRHVQKPLETHDAASTPTSEQP